MPRRNIFFIIAVLFILVVICIYGFNVLKSNDNEQNVSSKDSQNNIEDYYLDLQKNIKGFPKEDLLIPHNNENITISVEDISNMLNLSGIIYMNISNFIPQHQFIADDKLGNSYAYIFFEVGGGNHSGEFLLLKFNLSSKKTEGILRLPRQNIYLNKISLSPHGENLAILTSYTDLPIHFDESSKLNLFLSIVNLNLMSVDYTFKFETYSSDDMPPYDFKWIDDNNIKIDLFDENGTSKSEFLNLNYISY